MDDRHFPARALFQAPLELVSGTAHFAAPAWGVLGHGGAERGTIFDRRVVHHNQDLLGCGQVYGVQLIGVCWALSHP